MKYEHPIETAKEILSASGVHQEPDDSYYFILNGKLSFYDLTKEIATRVINETLEAQAIDYFDSQTSNDGTIEINGQQISIEYE
jgi:hypothetical protein